MSLLSQRRLIVVPLSGSAMVPALLTMLLTIFGSPEEIAADTNVTQLRAAPIPPNGATRSVSGQFIVQSETRAVALPQAATNRALVQLAPSLVAVSCERIKQAVWRELEWTEPWQSRVFVSVYRARSTNDPVTIGSERFRNGWQYLVALPDYVDRGRYVRAIVQVLLLEIANRMASSRTAELPIWLVEGFTETLLASSELQIILPPPTATQNGLMVASFSDQRKHNPTERVYMQLAGREPRTFNELSWPSEQDLSGPDSRVYRASAQLFTQRLMTLPEGRASMRALLTDLPKYYNWQFALLRAFKSDFQRPLDVEKWWALEVAYFAGRDPAQTWTLEESWRKLNEIVQAPVQLRSSTDDLPAPGHVSIETVVLEWSPALQREVLNNKIFQLKMARLRIAHEFAPLVDDYLLVIERYVQDQIRAAFLGGRRNPDAINTVSRNKTLASLNALAIRMEALRPTVASEPGVAQATPRVP
jgi:hypothetical protein